MKPRKLTYGKNLALSEIKRLRICAITSSIASIISGLLFIYFYGMIHPSRRKFRHQLIFMLICFDFIKAVAILVFSLVLFDTVSTENHPLINGIGWLTTFGIEGADIVILMFAIHLAMLVFNYPYLSSLKKKFILKLKSKLNSIINLKSKILNRNSFSSYSDSDSDSTEDSENGNTHNLEGGLYGSRFTVKIITILFPVLISSVGFYIDDIYEEYIFWSYFRQKTAPWYFSWVVRHFVLITILIIYVSIYIYVMFQFKKVSKNLKNKFDSNDQSNNEINDIDNNKNNDVFLNAFGDSIWYKLFQFLAMFIFPDIHISAKLHGQSLDTDEDLQNIQKLKIQSKLQNDSDNNLDLNSNSIYANVANNEISKQIQNLLFEEAMERFNSRKSQIMRQMKITFIYPISYFFLWLFPIIYHYEIIDQGYGDLWTVGLTAFFLPLNCFVDFLVFLLREKPWKLTRSVDELSGINSNNLKYNHSNWRHYISWLPGYENYNKIIFEDQLEMKYLHETMYGHGLDNDNSKESCDYCDGQDRYNSIINNNNNNNDDIDIDIDNYYNESTNSNFNDKEYSIVVDYDTNNTNSSNNNDEVDMDLKDFLNSSHFQYSTQNNNNNNLKNLKHGEKLRPSSISNNNLKLNNRPSSSFSSTQSQVIGSRRASKISWRTWSIGSTRSNKSTKVNKLNGSNTGGTIGKQQTLGSIHDYGSSVSIPLKGSNTPNWNLHMFDNGKPKVYNIDNNNLDKKAETDDEMDIMSFLKLGPRG